GVPPREPHPPPPSRRDPSPSSFWPRRSVPGQLVVEASHDPATLEGLRGRGHLVEVAEPWSLGRTCAAGRDPATGFLVAAANPRGRAAYAVGAQPASTRVNEPWRAPPMSRTSPSSNSGEKMPSRSLAGSPGR